jgi:hypothetical protein
MATIDVRKGPDGKVVYRARIRRKSYPTQTGTFPTRSEAKKWVTITDSELTPCRRNTSFHAALRVFAIFTLTLCSTWFVMTRSRNACWS